MVPIDQIHWLKSGDIIFMTLFGGVGSFLGVHEGPQSISKSPINVVLKPGMIISNEPGYY